MNIADMTGDELLRVLATLANPHRLRVVAALAEQRNYVSQLAVFDMRNAGSPCYHCLFGEGDELEETRCATMGVFAPLVGIIGSAQAAETLKLVARIGASLEGRLLVFDALAMSFREMHVPRDPACAVCGSRPG